MIAEVPGAVMILADASNYRARPDGVGYDIVVIHGTSGRENARAPAADLQKPGHGSSFHFIVGQRPLVVYQCVPLRFAAQHAHKDINPHSIGIEHCMREPNEPNFPKGDPGLPPTEEQYRSSARLVAYLLLAGGFPPTRQYVRGHAEVDEYTTHTGCPEACGWDWGRYMSLVRAAYMELAPDRTPVG